MDVKKSLMRVGVAGHVAMYRLTGGRVGASMGGSPVVLLTPLDPVGGDPAHATA